MGIKSNGGPTAHVLVRANLVRRIPNEGVVLEFAVSDVDHAKLHHHVAEIGEMFGFDTEYRERVAGRIYDLDLERCLTNSARRVGHDYGRE